MVIKKTNLPHNVHTERKLYQKQKDNIYGVTEMFALSYDRAHDTALRCTQC
jgi:hypothetical protein